MCGGMPVRMRIALVVGCLIAAFATAARADAIGLQPVGNFNEPVHVTAPPGDPRLFVVERPGFIQVIHDGITSQFLDIHDLVNTDGERGLLSMAFDPQFAQNGLFYVYFTDSGSAGASLGDNHVDEFRVTSNPNVVDPATRRPVLTLVRGTSASNHNGGQLQFGKDGLLYVSVGDAANGSNAQSLGSPHGKILRIDPHGASPGAHGAPGNPFVGTPGAVPEIWSWGLRNPFRFSFDHKTGDLVIGDVGATAWEEIDFAPAAAGLGRGTNFGWPDCEGFTGTGCGTTYTNPVFAYPHSNPGGDQAYGSAIIGGYVYRGTQIPELSGRYLYADLAVGELRSIQLGLPLAAGDRAESAPGALSGPNSFGEDSSCELYVTSGDEVDKIIGSGSAAAPACPAEAKCLKHKRKHHKKKHRAADAKKHKKHKKKLCKKKRKHKKKKSTPRSV
jgi:glucose/arabinose dehydrogenase